VLKVNLRDGSTLTFDLSTEAGRKDWQRRQGDPHFQAEITGAGILHDGVLHAMPVPSRFRSTQWEAEPIWKKNGSGPQIVADRLTCYADATRLSITVHHGSRPRVVRFSAARVGRLRYSPRLHGSVEARDREGGEG